MTVVGRSTSVLFSAGFQPLPLALCGGRLVHDLARIVSPGRARRARTPDPLLAKHGQDVQHRPWPGTERSWRPPEYGDVQAYWCRLWVSPLPTRPGA